MGRIRPDPDHRHTQGAREAGGRPIGPRLRRPGLTAAGCLLLVAGCAGLLPRAPGEENGGSGAPPEGGRPTPTARDSAPGEKAGAEGDSAAAPAADTAAAGPGAEPAPEKPPTGPVFVTDVEELRALGPAFTPFDRGPRLAPGDWLKGLLEVTLVPVIREYEFEPDRMARYWVLVDTEGQVRDAVLHLTSGSTAFDEAARAAALALRYTPAFRDGERVPVWVLQPISLLMR